MKHSREFEIAWQGLKPGLHTFVYDIDDQFMHERQSDDSFSNWSARIVLTFDKKESFFMLHFDVDGSVTTSCDRCGDDFRLRLWDEFDLVIKLTGDETDEKDDEDDVIFISRSETVIDLANWLYEFVMLSVPLHHIHPDAEDGSSSCNQLALSLLDKLSASEDTGKNDIWKGLKLLEENFDSNSEELEAGKNKKNKKKSNNF